MSLEPPTSIVDPYALFGIPKEQLCSGGSDSLAEIRKRYFELSLLCHPDKGGNTEDMITLQRSYDVVRAGMRNVALSETRMESIVKFEDIIKECFVSNNCQHQQMDNNIPFDNEAFIVEARTNTDYVACTLPGGYGDDQCDNDDDQGDKDDDQGDMCTGDISEFRPFIVRDLMLQISKISSDGNVDFSVDAPQEMFDYHAAYTVPLTYFADPREKRDIDKLLAEREE
jgi:hypothetical protein